MLRKKETWSRLQHERRINTNIYLSYKHMVNQLWSQSSISGDRSWAQGAKTMDKTNIYMKCHFLSSRFGWFVTSSEQNRTLFMDWVYVYVFSKVMSSNYVGWCQISLNI
jgi:hypothetical protein